MYKLFIVLSGKLLFLAKLQCNIYQSFSNLNGILDLVDIELEINSKYIL